MQDDYKNSFDNELPQLKTDDERKAVKAAVLRFVNEIRQQIVDISTKNNTRVVTGELEVSVEPKVVLKDNPNRKVAYIKNTGTFALKVYGIDVETDGGFILNSSEQVLFHGTNAIAVATISGMSSINYLDS